MRKKDLSRVITFVAIIAVLALAAAFAISCGSSGSSSSSSSSSGTSGGTIKIGTLYPVTGDLAKLGQECVNAVKLAVDEINAAGGIKSMGGAKIELVEADSQGKPDVGISEVQRLVSQNHVSAIIGTYQSSVAIPATQTADRLKTPILISMAVADEITEHGYKYVFRLCPKADWYAKSQLDFVQAMAAARPDLQSCRSSGSPCCTRTRTSVSPPPSVRGSTSSSSASRWPARSPIPAPPPTSPRRSARSSR